MKARRTSVNHGKKSCKTGDYLTTPILGYSWGRRVSVNWPLVSTVLENKNSYKCMLFTTKLFVANLLKRGLIVGSRHAPCERRSVARVWFKISVKRQLSKLVITFSLTALQPRLRFSKLFSWFFWCHADVLQVLLISSVSTNHKLVWKKVIENTKTYIRLLILYYVVTMYYCI